MYGLLSHWVACVIPITQDKHVWSCIFICFAEVCTHFRACVGMHNYYLHDVYIEPDRYQCVADKHVNITGQIRQECMQTAYAI